MSDAICIHHWPTFNPHPCPDCAREQGAAVQVRVAGDIGMAALLGDVRAFHRACDVPIGAQPEIPGRDRVELRDRLLVEEVKEWQEAVECDDLVGVADALADIIYIAVGTAIEFGIPLDRVWAEVQRSNMAKVDPATGKALRREDGKILKPDNWTPPNVAGAIGI
jgi:predicted HAD superfamily Cof-like phosphohydrolase